MLALRPYQDAAIEASRAVFRRGKRRVLIVAPTGAGKTVIASHIVASGVALGSSILFLAHRRELIAQAYRKLVGCTCSAGYAHDSFLRDPTCRGDGLAERDVGVIMAGDRRRRPTARVQVASVDSIRNRAKPRADIVIIDEAHRALARSYRDITAHYPEAIILGLTATPYRADGKGLGDMFEDLVVVASPRTLIDDGYLVEPRVWTVPARELPDLSHVRIRGGDYDERELAVAVDHVGLVGGIVDHWTRRAGGARTVAFAASVDHSKHIAEKFRAAGVAAEHLDGTTPTHERDAILARLERGDTRVVANCAVLCEGWDQPAVKCAILARPTKSLGMYLQCAGRILRPWQGAEALILDHAGCVLDHGLPQAERSFTLAGRVKKSRESDPRPSCKTCEGCFAIVASTTLVCPRCGFEWPVAAREDLRESDHDLVEVREVTEDEKRAHFEELKAKGIARGAAPGWAAHQYRDKFGAWPPRAWGRAPPVYAVAADDEKLRYLEELRATCVERGYQRGWIRARFMHRYGHEIPFEWMLPARMEAS